VFGDTLEWRDESEAAGRKWVVANDEQGGANSGVVPDANDPSHDVIRKNVLWGNIMAGGAGVEYYFGYNYANSDLTCEDFRSRSNMWDQSLYTLEFFANNAVPFWDMSNDNSRVSNGWCLSQTDDDVIVVYLKDGGSSSIDLTGSSSYTVKWYDPRNGGSLKNGSVTSLGAGNNQALGNAPSNGSQDWVVLLQRDSAPSPPTPTPVIANRTPIPATSPTMAPMDTPVALPTKTPMDALVASSTKAPTDSPVASPPGVGSITSFTLIDASANTDIRLLTSGSVIDLWVNGSMLNVRADVAGTVNSVTFGLDSNANFRTENVWPFALGGDSNEDYFAVGGLSQTGQHTVTAAPFSEKYKQGIKGSTTEVTFTVLDANARRALRKERQDRD